MKSENFTSRAAGWSAAHRKAVVRGWLAFVLVAFALGSLAGMVQLKAVEAENGQSRLADQTQAQQFPRERAGEEVLIENPERSARRHRLSRGLDRSRRAPVKHPVGRGDQVAACPRQRGADLEERSRRAGDLPDH